MLPNCAGDGVRLRGVGSDEIASERDCYVAGEGARGIDPIQRSDRGSAEAAGLSGHPFPTDTHTLPLKSGTLRSESRADEKWMELHDPFNSRTMVSY